MNIVIISRDQNKFSETFIGNQLRNINGNIFPLYGTAYPYTYKGTPLEVTGSIWPIFKTKAIDRGDLLTTAFRRFFREHKIDMVLANFATTAFDVMEACRSEGVKLVVHFHGWTVYRTRFVEQNRSSFGKLFHTADRIIAVSTDMYQRLLDMGASEDKLVQLPYGIDSTLFEYTERNNEGKPLLLLSVGRFTEKKCPHLLILAFEKVLKQYPDARLVMVGDGHLLDSTKMLAQAMGLSKSVNFTGALEPKEVGEWMQRAAIFVQHSATAPDGNSEGTPNTLLEACFSGLPVVSTRHGGIMDVIEHGYNGLLVEELDWQAMADCIIDLAGDKARQKVLALAAYNSVKEKNSLSNYLKQLNLVIKEAATDV